MSRYSIHAFARSLSIASAASILYIGAAAAAAPQTDFQRQVSTVVAGNFASHSSLPASRTGGDSTGSRVDAQQFARRLLMGWSASHPASARSARSATQWRGPSPSGVTQQDSSARVDVQSTVQRFLLGGKAARGAS